MPTRDRLIRALPLLCFALACAAELSAIRALQQGAFTYTLDDPYIHLALAENIARGHYGVNVGELSAPSSSILWPFLLAPFARASWGDLAPLLLNLAAGALTVEFAQRFLLDVCAPRARSGRLLVALATMIFFLSCNLLGLIFTGMEHSLQVMLVVAALYGARVELRTDRMPWWTLLSLTLLPIVRYESLVLSAPLSAYFARRGHTRQALWANGVSALVLVAFSAFLASHDLGFLPTSVQAKSDLSLSTLARVSNIVKKGWENPHVAYCFLFLFAFALLAALRRTARERELACALLLASAGHLYIGNFGWFDRYELYLFIAQVLTLAWLLSEPVRALDRPRALWVCALATVTLLSISGTYLTRAAQTPGAARNMYEQQRQMHRFVVEHYPHPVAVHDLGLVTYRNDNYVLDLNGLASLEVLLAARAQREPVWRERLAREHQVRLAMIYDQVPGEVPTSWISVGTLSLAGPNVTAAFPDVAFYATSRDAAEELRGPLARFSTTLPPGVTFASSPVPAAARALLQYHPPSMSAAQRIDNVPLRGAPALP